MLFHVYAVRYRTIAVAHGIPILQYGYFDDGFSSGTEMRKQRCSRLTNVGRQPVFYNQR